jgi:AraC-like DNA-binding protein
VDFNGEGARVMLQVGFRCVRFGVETLGADAAKRPRHRHASGYATVVLSGAFVESSFAGRSVARPGDVLLHASLDCHANTAIARGPIQILRLPWNLALEGHFRVADPDRLARLGEVDPGLASAELATALLRPAAGAPDWTHSLALALSAVRPLALSTWGEAHGLRPDELSRGFQREFGVSPKRFRLEARARRAWYDVVRSDQPLTRIAQDHEFADLAHMSRSIRAFTGRAPSLWRTTVHQPAAVQMRSS